MISNLKTNEKALTKNKIKLQKRYIVPTTLMISATVLLTGCANHRYYDYATIKPIETVVDVDENTANIEESSQNITVSTSTEYEIDNYYDEIRQNNPSKRVTEDSTFNEFNFIETEITKNFIEQLNATNVEYTYTNIYNSQEALKKYETKKEFSNEHKEILQNITTDSLYNKVLENNKSYLESKNVCFYDELSNKDIRVICGYIVEAYNDCLIKQDINIDETKCILNNLKVFEGASAANAFVTDEYCMVVSPGMIEVLGIMNDNKDVDVFKNTIIHETMHLGQMSCPDRINETDKIIGITPQYDDLSLNPLDFSWYYEASAEKCTVNHTKDGPLVYEYMINYLESLSLATIMNDNVKVAQNETNCFSKDLNSIFKMFNCTTDEEKIEIINMMYSIQIIETEPEEFFDSLNGMSTYNEKYALKKDLRSSICTTLTKYFYRNLIEQSKNKNVTLEDLYFLIVLFENDVNNHINYNSIENYPYYEKFLLDYQQIQNSFFEVVAASSGYEYEKILEDFNNYALYNKNQQYNASLEWVDKDKQQYLIERQQYLSEYSTASIRFVVEKRTVENEIIK